MGLIDKILHARRTAVGGVPIANQKWRMLKKRMPQYYVRGWLGQPDEIVREGDRSVWKYPNGGSVTFDTFYLAEWSAPR